MNDNERNSKYLSTKITGSEINLFSDSCISEIQLNIFPPSALYTPRLTSQKQDKPRMNNAHNESPLTAGNCLSIDVHENKLHALLNEMCNENKQRSGIGSFSHISFKKRDSILHITIGSSSKIIKKSKQKRRWLFAKLNKLSRRSSGKRDNNQKYLDSKFGSRERGVNENSSIYHISDTDNLNIVNDNLVITVNKKPCERNQNHNNDNNQFNRVFEDGDIDYGANELDFYMNEIKKRENSGGYEI